MEEEGYMEQNMWIYVVEAVKSIWRPGRTAATSDSAVHHDGLHR